MAMRKMTGFREKRKWQEATNEGPSWPHLQDHCDWKSLLRPDELEDRVLEDDAHTTGGKP
jgi:hypothetical protein